MTSPNFREFRKQIYALKRKFPQIVDIYRTVGDVTNFKTGVMSVSSVQKVNVRRAILVPSSGKRGFSYDQSYVTANRNFTLGGWYDHKLRKIIVSRRDVPSSFKLDMNIYFIFQGRAWKVKDLQEIDVDESILFTLDGLETQVYNNLINAPNIVDTITPTDTAL